MIKDIFYKCFCINKRSGYEVIKSPPIKLKKRNYIKNIMPCCYDDDNDESSIEQSEYSYVIINQNYDSEDDFILMDIKVE